MKRLILALVGVSCSLCMFSTDPKDDFDEFMSQELSSFKSFMDEADRDFVEFLRDPWVQIKAQPAQKQRKEPEPEKPIVCDEKESPKPTTPVNLEDLLKKSGEEGKTINKSNEQKNVGKIDSERSATSTPQKDVTTEQPVTTPAKEPVTTPAKEPVTTPAKEPVTTPAKEPVTTPAKEPVTTPAKEPVTTPAKEPVTTPAKEPVTTPAKEPVTTPAKEPVTTPAKEPVTTPAKEPVKTSTDPIDNAGENRVKIVYNECNLYVDNTLKGVCNLKGVDENSIADAYQTICTANGANLISDLKQIRLKLSLNDWGMYTLVETTAKALCGNGDERIVMQQYLLNELGFSTKIARSSSTNKLVLLAAADCMIYAHPAITYDGVKYFCFEDTKSSSYFVCPKNSSKAKNVMKMELTQSPNFGGQSKVTSHKSLDGNVRVDLNVSEPLMSFYRSYPQCEYNIYANASIDKQVEKPLLQAISKAIAGKSESQAADIILNFIQTGFDYATDQQQFGYEKPFFVEEVFYYPQCDCEDRAVIYRYLVKKLIGLDVLLISYPNHLATAVNFNEEVSGYYITHKGKKYTICDPTYIGASIGNCMPDLRSISPNVVAVD